MVVKREGSDSPFPQGQYEEIAYKFNFAPWGGSPSNPSATMWQKQPNGEEVDTSTANLSGSESVSGDIVTTPVVLDLLPESVYRLAVNVDIDGNKMEAYITLRGER